MANPIVHQINAELTALQRELGKFKETVDYLNNAKNIVKDAVLKVNHSESHFNNKVGELKQTYNSFIKLTDSVSEVILKIETINFPDRLDSIERIVLETITTLNDIRKATLDELQKASEIILKVDFDGQFKKLQSIIDSSIIASEALAKSIENQKLPEKIEAFEKNINKKLDGVEKKVNETLDYAVVELEQNTEKIAKDTAKSIHDLNIPIRIDKLDANISGIMAAIQSNQSRIDILERNISDKMRDLSERQKEEMTNIKNTINTANKKNQLLAYVTLALITGAAVTIILLKYNHTFIP